MATKDFVADFGAPINGSGDCVPAITAWRSWIVAHPGDTLTIPAHVYNMEFAVLIASDPDNIKGFYPDTNIIPSCTITGTGGKPKIKSWSWMGVYNAFPNTISTCGGFLETCYAGATTVNLKDAGDASKFFVGGWLLMCGIATQSQNFPANFQRYEYHQITGISGTTITLDSDHPLQYGYSDTWPNTHDVDTPGGAAAAYSLGPGNGDTGCWWDHIFTTSNLEFMTSDSSGDSVMNSSGVITTPPSIVGLATGPYRSLTCNDVIFNGQSPGGSYNKNNVYNGCTITAYAPEIDKCVESLTYDNCLVGHLNIQSASPELLTVRNGCHFTGGFNGFPKNTIISDSLIETNFNTGTGYGRCETLTVTSSTIPAPVMATHGIVVGQVMDAITYLGSGLFIFGSNDNNKELNFQQAVIPGFQYAFAYVTGDADTYPDPQFTTPRVVFCVTDISEASGAFTYNHYFQTDLTYAAAGSDGMDNFPAVTFNTHAWNAFQALPFKSFTIDGVHQVVWEEEHSCPVVTDTAGYEMNAGTPYFAWIDPGETTFTSGHMRWDEDIFSFTLQQSEGDPASLTLVVRRPRNDAGNPIGLLGPGRKIWCWFALDCGPDLIKFRGRLVGVPTSIFEELVTLEFVARPIDLVPQKEALAQTLRVLPYYDEVVLDPTRRTDPEVVLEGYTAVWHYDRETHVLTISDEIAGEDGTVSFDGTSADATVLYDGLALSLTSGPLSRVDVQAEYTWTQQAVGSVDLTKYLISNWPNEGYAAPGSITSFTFGDGEWPKNGANIGEGWEAAEATARAVYDLKVTSNPHGFDTTIKWWDGETTHCTVNETRSTLVVPPGSISYGAIVTTDKTDIKYAKDQDGLQYTSSVSRNLASTSHVLPLLHTVPTLLAGYTAARQCTELVSFSLVADVQHVLTDPEDGEALRIDDVRSVNLSEAIGAAVPIGDPRRRSYIATARGNQSLEHLLALARAHLMKRARVVEIAVAPKLARMPEITLRKNALLVEPRVGEALGKIIGYSLALSGSDGRINCEVRIGCTIGRGGSAVGAAGTPTYCSTDYTGADYQQFSGRTVLVDSSVGYAPPGASPNDDGMDFLSVLTATDVIDTDLVVENPPAVQRAHLTDAAPPLTFPHATPTETLDEARQAMVEARSQAITNALKEVETRATFKLKNMNRAFSTTYDIQVTDLKIPTGYDLEAA
jgi:hypothetical protein